MTPKPEKDARKKENYKSIYLKNIDVKIINIVLASQIQHYIKKIIHYDKVQFFSRDVRIVQHSQISQFNIHNTNKIKDLKNPMMISVAVEKTFAKIQHQLMIRSFNKAGTQWTYLNMTKAIYDKPTANIILNDEMLIYL